MEAIIAIATLVGAFAYAAGVFYSLPNYGK
jgi:hypothetical protein